jgi:hypothetical protein
MLEKNKLDIEGGGNIAAGEAVNITNNHYYAASSLPEVVINALEIAPSLGVKKNNNLPDLTPNFTGRVKERALVREALLTGNTTLIAQAGTGKSTLATHIAHDLIDDFPYVWWVNAQSSATANQNLIALAAEFQDFHTSETVQVRLDALKRHMQERGKDCLIILDNINDKAQFDKEYKAVCGKARVLITSRAPGFTQIGKQIELLPFDNDEACAFLKTCLPHESDESLMQDLSARLGYLPLVLHHAASYIDLTGCGIAGYLARLDKYGLTRILNESANRASNHERSLPFIIALSRQHLKETMPMADVLLQLLSNLAENQIPQALLSKIDPEDARFKPFIGLEDDLERDNAFELLRKLGLITTGNLNLANLPPEWKPCVSLHRLTREIVAGDTESFVAPALQHLLYKATFIDSKHKKYWGIYESLLKHVEHELPKAFELETWEEKRFFYGHLAQYYEIVEGSITKSLKMWSNLVEFEQKHEAPLLIKASTYLSLAKIHTLMDEKEFHLNQANKYYALCLKIKQENLHSNDPSLMITYATYSLLLLRIKKPTKAKDFHSKAMAIYNNLENKKEVFMFLSHHARYLNETRKYAAAKKAHLHLLEIEQKLFDADEIDQYELGKTYHNLSITFENNREWTESLSYAKKAVQLANNLPETHRDRINCEKRYDYLENRARR